MSFLIFDIDRSLAALGSTSDILDLTGGIPPVRITGGAGEVMRYLDHLYIKNTTAVPHPLFKDLKETHTQWDLTPQGKELKVEGIVIDTISHLFTQDKRIIEAQKNNSQLELQDWGRLERLYSGLMQRITRIPAWVIINSHVTFDKDQASGKFYFQPDISGSTKGSIPQYMDCVFYTTVSMTKEKERVYQWLTATDGQKFGKDRLGKLRQFILQDYDHVLGIYREAGHAHPRILTLGETGTGKTKSLSTLNKGRLT